MDVVQRLAPVAVDQSEVCVWWSTLPGAPSQQSRGFTGSPQDRRGFAPQLFALQADWLCHQEGGGRQVVGGGLLLVSVVDVAGDEEGDFPDLQVEPNTHHNQAVTGTDAVTDVRGYSSWWNLFSGNLVLL